MENKNMDKSNIITETAQPSHTAIDKNKTTNTPTIIDGAEEKKAQSSYIQGLFKKIGIPVVKENIEEIKQFIKNKKIKNYIKTIQQCEKEIMDLWTVKQQIKVFQEVPLQIDNATVGSEYGFTIDSELLEKYYVINSRWEIPEELGITFQEEENKLTGIPTKNGEFELLLWFILSGEGDNAEEHKKKIKLIINPDPKTLWKNIPTNKDDIFYKEDNASDSGKIGGKQFIVSSKRGRSHQNNGSFRDDDYDYKFYEDNGWSVIAVSDGAGSAKLSREGSRFSCQTVIEFFADKEKQKALLDIDKELQKYAENKHEELRKTIDTSAKKALYQATRHVHSELIALAQKTQTEKPELFENEKRLISDHFHATLIFVVFKYFDGLGYVFFTFGVGDCPIGLMKGEETQLLNRLDVGEFGGGTRFITQNEIFQSDDMASRFNMHIAEDFDYLFLMTDGIYDAKFEVEANLVKPEKWLLFLNDLKGANEDKIAINFDGEVKTAEEELNTWIDFWSKGNHDDRTLFIVY